jgi:ATP-dependent helicase/nuclease subunit B
MRVFNVPSSAPFLGTVIEALAGGRLVPGFDARAHPERLADVTLYLPTRRAGRMAREVFLDVLGTDAVLLPRIVALGSVDEDELEFSDIAAFGGADALRLPPPIDDLARRLTLARLVAAWARNQPDSLVVGSPASTLALAGDLARLMDDMVTRGVGWRALDDVVPDELDVHWQHTLKFLKIARDAWPAYLAEIGRMEPAARRDRLIDAEIARLAASPKGPVIAAGSTGSMPATAKLLRAIAAMPNGAVVLPGLDTHLDAAAWDSIGDVSDDSSTPPPTWSHPQFALHHLLSRVFDIARDEVVALAEPAPHGREVLASEAMRPAAASAQWHTELDKPEVAARIAAAMTNLAVIEAANPEAEALAIAVALREAREHGLTAALVTPDRALARRVMASLDRWGLAVDDSGGDSLMDTPAGLFARLAAATVADDLAPPVLLALLKHPLFRLGRAQGEWSAATGDLELALLRGPRPPPGCAGLRGEFARFRSELGKLKRQEPSALHGSEPRARLDPTALDHVQALIEALARALAPLEQLHDRKPHDVTELAARHYDVIAALARDDRQALALFQAPGGRELARGFDDLFGADAAEAIRSDTTPYHPPPCGLAARLGDYPDLFRTAFADRTVRRPQNSAAHLRIYGPLEARLTESDRVILGGLIEGVWPPAPRVDPWLSRPMRHQLGLDLPERRIGLSAHDFAQLLGAKDLILSRTAKAGGAPAVASRFLHRLEAVAGNELWAQARARGAAYVRWANACDHPATVAPAPQPMPKPALALRPTRMSVTEIEDWLRDPYTIYARRILGLVPLDPVDMPPTAADRGSAIHAALNAFTTAYPDRLPDDAAQALRAIGADCFAPLMERPEARALWWPRFLRIASWFAGWEGQRRIDVARIDSEIRGELKIALREGRVFTLTARADRIEHRADRSFALLDYKTGQPPTGKQVYLGLSPQLTLEAAILRGGGFADIAAGAMVSELAYVRLSGNNPAGEERMLDLRASRSDPPQLPDDAADAALRQLTALIQRYDNADEPYRSVVLTMWANRYGTYDDLARIREWSAGGGGSGGDE